jgi:hypothetical protein
VIVFVERDAQLMASPSIHATPGIVSTAPLPTTKVVAVALIEAASGVLVTLDGARVASHANSGRVAPSTVAGASWS